MDDLLPPSYGDDGSDGNSFDDSEGSCGYDEYLEYDFSERKKVWNKIFKEKKDEGDLGNLQGGHIRFAVACTVICGILWGNPYPAIPYGLAVYGLMMLFYGKSGRGRIPDAIKNYGKYHRAEIHYQNNRVSLMSATVTAIQVGAEPSLTLKEQFQNICHVVIKEEFNERQQKRSYPHYFATPLLIVLPLVLLALTFRSDYSYFNVFVTILVIFLWIVTANKDLENSSSWYFDEVGKYIWWVDGRVRFLYREYGAFFYHYHWSPEEKFERHPHMNEIIRSLERNNYPQNSENYSIDVGLRNKYESDIGANNREIGRKKEELIKFFSAE